MNRLIIAGGRDTHPGDYDGGEWLLELCARHGWPSKILCGGAPGADAFGKAWAEIHGIGDRVEMHSPWDPDYTFTWERHGRRAGPLRNQAMASQADSLALFPGGDGSADMRRAAHAAGLAVYVYPELFAERSGSHGNPAGDGGAGSNPAATDPAPVID